MSDKVKAAIPEWAKPQSPERPAGSWKMIIPFIVWALASLGCYMSLSTFSPQLADDLQLFTLGVSFVVGGACFLIMQLMYSVSILAYFDLAYISGRNLDRPNWKHHKEFINEGYEDLAPAALILQRWMIYYSSTLASRGYTKTVLEMRTTFSKLNIEKNGKNKAQKLAESSELSHIFELLKKEAQEINEKNEDIPDLVHQSLLQYRDALKILDKQNTKESIIIFEKLKDIKPLPVR